jgi:aminoglycoside phosphotransferase (APT) family kinase protein
VARLPRRSRALGQPVTIERAEPLTGGAVRRHWRLDAAVAGEPRVWVLRADGATPLGLGLDLGDEFALLCLLAGRGAAVPPPVAHLPGLGHLTAFVAGSADPAAMVASGPHGALAERLGAELALIQRVGPPLFFGDPPRDLVAARLAHARVHFDAMGEARPAAEWAMRCLARLAPRPLPPVLCHGDFRTGNYLAADGRLAALLGWEFAAWGDPDEDLGWFCSRCWRYGADAQEAGGIAPRAALLRGYEAASGRPVDPERLRF